MTSTSFRTKYAQRQAADHAAIAANMAAEGRTQDALIYQREAARWSNEARLLYSFHCEEIGRPQPLDD